MCQLSGVGTTMFEQPVDEQSYVTLEIHLPRPEGSSHCHASWSEPWYRFVKSYVAAFSAEGVSCCILPSSASWMVLTGMNSIVFRT